MTVSISLFENELSKVKDTALLLGFFKGNLSLSGELQELDSSLGNVISSFMKDNHFKAEKGELKNIYISKNIRNIVLVGLGEENKYNLDVLSTVMADASKRLRDNDTESFSIFLDSFNPKKFKDNEIIEKTALSVAIGLYSFTEYKTKDRDKAKSIKKITLIKNIKNSSKNFEKELNYASIIADAVNKTRHLVNTPPNVATPEYIANYAEELAKKSSLKCTVFDEKQIEKLKMGCFIGVSQGSVNKPRLVILEYHGAEKSQKPIAIVGKGVTFDSGGLNLKPYPFILNMKDDKAGAIASMHIIEACSKLMLPINVVVITPLCENMPSGASFRPDDVLKAYNGMTVEIKNTDAEGRLILADALSYAAEFEPQAIIDIATLTGASLVALGTAGTPFLSTSEKIRERIKEASIKSLEKVWEFPLWPEYEENIRSEVADLKHISEDGDAGVIMGATFLKNFVNEIPWAHIDIGTTAWSKVDKGMLTKGATGVTVRLLMEMLREWE
ncbi:MAG: leucyl aminopeptidase [Nanoarchaeota archaeon]